VVFLHRDAVDFHKSINGLLVIVTQQMQLEVQSKSLFVFCNKRRDKLKVLYWDQTGYALWYKRLEQAHFKWPKKHCDEVITLNAEQWQWLLRGLDFLLLQPHPTVPFAWVE
jgi:transposase